MKLVYLVNLLTILLTLGFTSAHAQTHIDTLTSEVTTPKPDVMPTAAEDKLITDRIKSHIKNSITLAKLNVNVTTQKGVVTFSGNVDSDTQAGLLIEYAQSIVGVRDVEAPNLMIKDSKEPFADMMTTAKIKGLFIREDIFGTKDIASINISVETKNGVVYLSGVINNQEQIKNAIKLIEGIKGVTKVEYNVTKVMPNGVSNTSST